MQSYTIIGLQGSLKTNFYKLYMTNLTNEQKSGDTRLYFEII